MKPQNKSFNLVLTLLALCGWFALGSQLYLILKDTSLTQTEALIRYFSYFTILTNLLVALYATSALLFPSTALGRFLGHPSSRAAIVVYMAIVGLIYNTVLRFTWQPTGLQKITDESLHLVMPLFYILFWYFTSSKVELKWRVIWGWAIYPLAYVIYVILRGIPSGYYPYPFVDVAKFGYQKVFINCVGVTVIFAILAFIVIWITRIRSRKNVANA